MQIPVRKRHKSEIHLCGKNEISNPNMVLMVKKRKPEHRTIMCGVL